MLDLAQLWCSHSQMWHQGTKIPKCAGAWFTSGLCHGEKAGVSSFLSELLSKPKQPHWSQAKLGRAYLGILAFKSHICLCRHQSQSVHPHSQYAGSACTGEKEWAWSLYALHYIEQNQGILIQMWLHPFLLADRFCKLFLHLQVLIHTIGPMQSGVGDWAQGWLLCYLAPIMKEITRIENGCKSVSAWESCIEAKK